MNEIENLIKALEAAIDSMEYVNHSHPEATGWGVRGQRIYKAQEAIKAYRALKISPAGPGLCLVIDPSKATVFLNT